MVGKTKIVWENNGQGKAAAGAGAQCCILLHHVTASLPWTGTRLMPFRTQHLLLWHGCCMDVSGVASPSIPAIEASGYLLLFLCYCLPIQINIKTFWPAWNWHMRTVMLLLWVKTHCCALLCLGFCFPGMLHFGLDLWPGLVTTTLLRRKQSAKRGTNIKFVSNVSRTRWERKDMNCLLSDCCMSLRKWSAWVLLCAALKVGSTNYDIVVFRGKMNCG